MILYLLNKNKNLQSERIREKLHLIIFLKAKNYQTKEQVTYKRIVHKNKIRFQSTYHIYRRVKERFRYCYDTPNEVEELKQPKKHSMDKKELKDILKYFYIV